MYCNECNCENCINLRTKQITELSAKHNIDINAFALDLENVVKLDSQANTTDEFLKLLVANTTCDFALLLLELDDVLEYFNMLFSHLSEANETAFFNFLTEEINENECINYRELIMNYYKITTDTLDSLIKQHEYYQNVKFTKSTILINNYIE